MRRGFLELYRPGANTDVDAEDLRTRYDTVASKIIRAALENRTSAGVASTWHSARAAWLIIDPIESHLQNDKIAIFDAYIMQKHRTAVGYYNTLRDNKMLLPLP